MPKPSPTYKELNGTTRVGDFLRKIGKSDFVASVIKNASKLGLPFVDVIGDMITSSKELDAKEKEYAIKLLEYDLEEAKMVSSRWNSDMVSDSWLSKNIRPLVLIYSWVLLSIMIFFKNEINTAYITLIEGLSITINVAYFGGRSVTKMFQIKNNRNVGL